MQAERWQQVKEVFHATLEHASHERLAYLRETSGDDLELQREVESLLAAHEASGRLEMAASELAAEWLEGQQPLLGQTLGHFRILAPLGSGGMGEVYLAEDSRLGRKVALKLLSAQLTADAERLRRFEQEAQAASALNHPNILTIHEIGETNGTHFIATEFIEGETLRERMGAPMKMGDLLDIAEQVASALAAAHEAGIIHRDIKPENIMVRRDALVKVLDFGLAKLTKQQPTDTEATTGARVKTSSGLVLGTVPYMSPEQALGRELDHRSDLFSLGVVLYEMATGVSPFAGANSSETLDRILHAQPEAISRFNHEAPGELERIVGKCLEKDRERRYGSARELLADLKNPRRGLEVDASATVAEIQERQRRPLASRHWLVISVLAMSVVATALGYQLLFRSAPTAVSPEIKSLAVLPFKSLNQEEKEDYLGLGIATDIITKVSQSGDLTVRPTSAVRKYVNQEMDALSAARELKVDAVLDSTYLQMGDQLRVTVNLLRVEDGASLWAEKFDERFTSIFAIQDKVSQQVAQRLRLRLSPAQQARLAKRYTSNLEAYNYYAKALYHSDNIYPDPKTRLKSDLAVDLFKKAIELDPNYALAHARLGYAYARIAVFQEDNPALIEEAKQELGIAERLDPQLAEVHAARYFIEFSQYEGWQVEPAIRELRLAQQLDPNAGHFGLADLYRHIGLDEQAVEEYELALKVDPNSDRIKNAYVGYYFDTARPDEGLEINKRLFSRGPDWRYYLEKRMVKEAAPLVEQEYQKDPSSPWKIANRVLLLALQGKHQEAQVAVSSILKRERRYRGYHHGTYNLARIYALGGKSEEAVKWLRVTVKEGFPCYPLFARDSMLDRIRKEPAFIQFMAEMTERWEAYRREFG